MIAIDAIGFYVQKILWPSPLAIDYGRTPAVALDPPWTNKLVAIAAVIAVGVASRRRPELGIAALIGVVCVLPYLGLVPFDFQRYSTVTDHYLYLARSVRPRCWPISRAVAVGHGGLSSGLA